LHASCGPGGAATYSDLEAARPARFSSKTADLGSFRPGGFAHKATILVASAEQLPALCTCRLYEDVVAMIRQLCPHDAEALFDFRRRSLLDAPLALTASPQDDVVASVEAARELLGRALGCVVFGAFAGELVGMLGFHVDRQLKRSHLGHVWGMYVAPAQRGRGYAPQLLDAVIAHAPSLGSVEWLQLSVSSTAPASASGELSPPPCASAVQRP